MNLQQDGKCNFSVYALQVEQQHETADSDSQQLIAEMTGWKTSEDRVPLWNPTPAVVRADVLQTKKIQILNLAQMHESCIHQLLFGHGPTIPITIDHFQEPKKVFDAIPEANDPVYLDHKQYIIQQAYGPVTSTEKIDRVTIRCQCRDYVISNGICAFRVYRLLGSALAKSIIEKHFKEKDPECSNVKIFTPKARPGEPNLHVTVIEVVYRTKSSPGKQSEVQYPRPSDEQEYNDALSAIQINENNMLQRILDDMKYCIERCITDKEIIIWHGKAKVPADQTVGAYKVLLTHDQLVAVREKVKNMRDNSQDESDQLGKYIGKKIALDYKTQGDANIVHGRFFSFRASDVLRSNVAKEMIDSYYSQFGFVTRCKIRSYPSAKMLVREAHQEKTSVNITITIKDEQI